MYSKEIEAYKETLKLSGRQRNVLVGLLLGDGHLETQNNGRTYRLKVEQSFLKKDYVDWIYDIFQDFVLHSPRENFTTTKKNLCFSTVSHGAFRFYAHQFYEGKKKKVPKKIHTLLTPEGLAVWFMDDGSVKSKECRGRIFNTQGFEKEDVLLLMSVLRKKFGIDASLRKQKEGFQIYIPAGSHLCFKRIIEKYILPSMLYKVE